MRDSYQQFFQEFQITPEEIIKYGVHRDTIFPDPLSIKLAWKNLLSSIKNNQRVYIRGYGRKSHGTFLYKELFKILLDNQNIEEDPTNNSKPTQLLESITE